MAWTIFLWFMTNTWRRWAFLNTLTNIEVNFFHSRGTIGFSIRFLLHSSEKADGKENKVLVVVVARYTAGRQPFHYSQETRPARSGSSDVATGNAALIWLLGSKANGYCIRVGVCSCDMQREDYGKPYNQLPGRKSLREGGDLWQSQYVPVTPANGLGPPQHSRATPRHLSIFFPWFTLTPRIILFQTYLNDLID